MTEMEMIRRRLYNQQIARPSINTAAALVNRLVAMQAQEWAMAKWAIGLRVPGSTDASIEEAFNRGEILRTHVLRPTWHFVTGPDIRWLLGLTAPRVHAFNAPYYLKMELDRAVFKKANKVLVRSLKDGRQESRPALKRALDESKIKTNDLRFTLLLMQAELEGIICSGARVNKQFTYALLEDRVPPAKVFHREEAAGELLRRYFITRGPATLQDFAWWSGLTIKEARAALSIHQHMFATEKAGRTEYIYEPSAIGDSQDIQATFLLPDYDEYGISYKDRSLLLPKNRKGSPVKNYRHCIIIDGRIGAGWQPAIKGKVRDVSIEFPPSTGKARQQAVKKAVKKYLAFIQGR